MSSGGVRNLPRIVAVSVVAFFLITALAAPALAQSVTRPDNPDLLVDASTHYTVDPEAGSVSVKIDYLLVNTTVDQQVTEFDEVLPDVASDVTASFRGRSLNVLRVGAFGGISTWRIQLPSVLRPGRSVKLVLLWSMVGEDPSEPGASVLINPAFVSLPVASVGGVGSLHAVDVTLPLGFRVIDAPGLTPISDTGAVRLGDSGTLEPYLSTTLMATRPTALLPRPVTGLDTTVDLLGWPGDAQWSAAVGKAVKAMVPQLTQWLGVPPVDSIEIREGPAEAYPEVRPGAVVARNVTLVIDSSADTGALGRRLAGIWLGSVLPDVDWFGPAAIAVFGTRAAQMFDPLASGPDETAAGFDRTAYSVVDSLVGEIGADGVAEVMTLVSHGAFTYPGPGDSTVAPLPADWKTLLDTFEGIGGSKKASELFRRVITDPADVSALDERASARADFATLQNLAAGWELPIWIRRPMAEWDFATFEVRRAVVNKTLAERDDLIESATVAGLDVGDIARTAFENETEGMAATNAVIKDQMSALKAIIEADRVINSNSGLISRIGLIGTDVASQRAGISVAFAAGEFDKARVSSDSLIKTIEGSNAVGILRIVVPAVVVLAVGLAAGELSRRRGRRSGGGGGEEVSESLT